MAHVIQFELSPGFEERFAEAAKIHGQEPSTYAKSLAEGAALVSRPVRKRDADAFLTAMGAFSDKTPALPEEAFTRESFYQDHD